MGLRSQIEIGEGEIYKSPILAHILTKDQIAGKGIKTKMKIN